MTEDTQGKQQPLRISAFQITLPTLQSTQLSPSSPTSSRPATSITQAPPAMASPLPTHSFHIQKFSPTNCTDRLTFMLIRPPKFTYLERILSLTPKFRHTVQRIPFPVSIFTPLRTPEYYLLYLHGNSSSRIQGMAMLDRLPDRVGLVCFDFEGCGNREGEWVTLGIRESQEADRVIAFLEARGYVVALWGRSMGAVSALLSQKGKVMVVDSAFSNLRALCLETVLTHAKYAPKCMLNCLFPCIYSHLNAKILDKTGQPICQLNILKRVSEIPIDRCIIFLAGQQDQIIPSHHSKQLYDAFKGVKDCCWFQGTHNSIRGKDILSKCFGFVERCLGMGTGTIGTGMMGQSRLVEISDLRMTYDDEMIGHTLSG